MRSLVPTSYYFSLSSALDRDLFVSVGTKRINKRTQLSTFSKVRYPFLPTFPIPAGKIWLLTLPICILPLHKLFYSIVKKGKGVQCCKSPCDRKGGGDVDAVTELYGHLHFILSSVVDRTTRTLYGNELVRAKCYQRSPRNSNRKKK